MRNIDPNNPVNKLAAFVVSESKERPPEVNLGAAMVMSETPLPMRQFSGRKQDNLTGRKCGDFTVIGCAVFLSKAPENNTRWVVKCKCGMYCHLSTRAVKKNHPSNACPRCRQNRHRIWRLKEHRDRFDQI